MGSVKENGSDLIIFDTADYNDEELVSELEDLKQINPHEILLVADATGQEAANVAKHSMKIRYYWYIHGYFW